MAKNQSPLFSAEYCGEIAILRIESRRLFDKRSVIHLAKEVTEAIAPRHRVILDMGRVDFVSSAMFGELISIHHRCWKGGGRLILCRIIPKVRESFRANKLDRLFQIVSTLDEAMAALRWTVAIRCPIGGCEGDALAHEPSIASRGGEFCCRWCGCRFRVTPFQLSSAGEARVAVSRFEIPTYEQELVCVELGAIVHLKIVGRLDLFAAEALVDAWRSLPQPRRTLLDLHAATELSEPGLRQLEEHVRAETSFDQVVVLVDPHRSDGTRAVLWDVQVTTTQDEALSVLRGSPGSDETPPLLLVSARTVERTAEQSQSRDAVTPAGEHGPSPSIP